MAKGINKVPLSKVLGSEREIFIGGHKFRVKQNDLQDLADFEEHIRSIHVADFLRTLEKATVELDSATISNTIAQLYSHILNLEEKVNLSRSLVGVRFFLTRAIQKCDPSIDEEDICQLVTLQNLDEVIRTIDAFNLPEAIVTGEDENPTVVKEQSNKTSNGT